MSRRTRRKTVKLTVDQSHEHMGTLPEDVLVEMSNREDPLQVSGDIVNTRPSGTKPR